MKLHTLEYVVTLAREHSFSRAAEKLFISQPSLSQSIVRLEQELGTVLFDRSKNPIQLTHAGETYVAWAQSVLTSQKKMQQVLADILEEKSVRLSVGISPHLSSYLLPQVLQQFYTEWPSCHINLEERPTTELYGLLEEGRIDLMIEREARDDLPFQREHLVDDRPVLAVPDGYPIIREGNQIHITMERVPVIALKRDARKREYLENVCRAFGFAPDYRMECRDVGTAHAMVAMGIGVAVLPELMIKHSPPQAGVQYYPIGNPPEIHPMSLLYRRGEYLPQAAKRLIALIKAFYSNSTQT